MSTKKISIIIPVYNCERYLEKCLMSVCEQSYSNLEIVVIDDGSTDKSRQIIERFGRTDARVISVFQENRGVAEARNRGINLASGEYLTFIDGDDYVDREYIGKLLECADREQAEMVICGLTYVDDAGHILKRLVPGEYKRFEKEEWTFRIAAVCSHFYRKELWDRYQIRFVSGERGEDLSISLFFAGKCESIVTLAYDGYFYVQHQDSARHNFKGLKTYNLPYRSMTEVLQLLRKTGINNSVEYHELFVFRILSTCFFELAPGASREKMQELCDFIVDIVTEFCPEYRKNKLLKVTAAYDVPITQKAAVYLMSVLVRTKLLYLAGRFLSSR